MPDAVSGDFQGVFDAAPVSLWIEDYSGIKSMFDGLRAAGVADIALHLQQHPDMVEGRSERTMSPLASAATNSRCCCAGAASRRPSR